MKNQLATAMAIALVLGTVGLSAVPTGLAVSPDCTEDYEITDTEDTRKLPGNSQEVGLSEVSAPLDETLEVTLETNNDKLEFGVFVMDGTDCVAAADEGLSDCDDSEVLDTTGSKSTQTRQCTLEAPSSGSIDYFVAFENLQSDSLRYSVQSA